MCYALVHTVQKCTRKKIPQHTDTNREREIERERERKTLSHANTFAGFRPERQRAGGRRLQGINNKNKPRVLCVCFTLPPNQTSDLSLSDFIFSSQPPPPVCLSGCKCGTGVGDGL
jgi:hypothetical protein